MLDQRKLRQCRLANEYKELMSINGSVIHIEPLGNAPYDKYRIVFNLRTIINPIPEYRGTTICLLTIPSGYPEIAPKIAVEKGSMPPPWHPNWYRGGTWCFGYWDKQESLVNYIYRCAKTIQFSPEFTDARHDAAANKEAVSFWNVNKNKHGMIPSDTKKLPTVDIQTPKISILNHSKSRISIFRNNN